MNDSSDALAMKERPRTGTEGFSMRSFWLILAAVIIADVLDLMDSTLTMIAAPTIASGLGGGELLIKWLGSSYSLALGVLLVIGGRLGDRYGHRRTFLVGIGGFTAASIVCGLAPTPGIIIAGRLLQGAFGALLIPQGLAIMTSVFPRELFGKAFSVFGPALGLASVGGPILGAFIVGADIMGLGWRPMFLINIVLGTGGFFLAWRALPRLPRDASVALDGLGSALLAAAMFCLIFGLIEGPTGGWQPPSIVAAAAGALFFAAFAVRQGRARNPLIKASLFRNRGFTAGMALGLAFFSVVTGLGYVLSLYFQQGLGRSPVQTALGGSGPLAVGIVVASFVASPLIGRLGRRLVLAGLVLTFAGVVALGAVIGSLGPGGGTWPLVAPIFVVGLGMGTCFGTLFDTALGDVDREEAGSASGSLSAVQQLAGSIGSAAITSIWFGRGGGSPAAAMTTCLAVVAAVTLGCCALVGLLPRRGPARAEAAESTD